MIVYVVSGGGQESGANKGLLLAIFAREMENIVDKRYQSGYCLVCSN